MTPKTVGGVNFRFWKFRGQDACENQFVKESFPMKTVAVIGASNDRSKYANKAVRAFLKAGYEVFPVHPAQTEVENLACYKTILDVPERPNLVSVYVGPSRLIQILPDIAAKGCDELWLNPGTESDEVFLKAEELKLNVVETCSIIAVGFSPSSL